MIKIVIVGLCMLTATGCTLSFSNISTHGTATDLVDETQAPQTEVSAEATIPAM